jgi:predicted transcriptional regulator
MTAPKRHPLEMTPEEEAASLAEAEADILAGRVVPHEKVAEWLKTWGTPDFKPMPREWLE